MRVSASDVTFLVFAATILFMALRKVCPLLFKEPLPEAIAGFVAALQTEESLLPSVFGGGLGLESLLPSVYGGGLGLLPETIAGFVAALQMEEWLGLTDAAVSASLAVGGLAPPSCFGIKPCPWKLAAAEKRGSFIKKFPIAGWF